MPYQYFNKGTCTHNKSHDTRDVRYSYICSACSSNGKTVPHAEVDYKNKLRKVTGSKMNKWVVTLLNLTELYIQNPKMSGTRLKSLSRWLCHAFRNTKVFPELSLISPTLRPSKNKVLNGKSSTQQIPLLSDNACRGISSNCVSPPCVNKCMSKIILCSNIPTVTGVPVKYGKCVLQGIQCRNHQVLCCYR